MIKRKWLAVLLAAAMMLCITGCGSDTPSGMVIASGEAADYLFYVPEGWNVDMTTGATSAYYSADDPSSISVMTWDLPAVDTTLEDWWAINLTDIQMVFQNVQMEKTENVTLDGVYAQSYTYTAELGEYTYKIQQTAAIHNATVYLVTYTSVPDTFDAHLEEVDSMVSYFRFK